MAETKAGEFERSLDRLEAIVKQLEGDGVGLDESVALFREGKQLAKRCEVLLGAARAAIETADGEEPAGKGTPSLFAGGGDTLSDEIEF
jgi:exodeoxyribonuclease VII small subunit